MRALRKNGDIRIWIDLPDHRDVFRAEKKAGFSAKSQRYFVGRTFVDVIVLSRYSNRPCKRIEMALLRVHYVVGYGKVGEKEIIKIHGRFSNRRRKCRLPAKPFIGSYFTAHSLQNWLLGVVGSFTHRSWNKLCDFGITLPAPLVVITFRPRTVLSIPSSSPRDNYITRWTTRADTRNRIIYVIKIKLQTQRHKWNSKLREIKNNIVGRQYPNLKNKESRFLTDWMYEINALWCWN